MERSRKRKDKMVRGHHHNKCLLCYTECVYVCDDLYPLQSQWLITELWPVTTLSFSPPMKRVWRKSWDLKMGTSLL